MRLRQCLAAAIAALALTGLITACGGGNGGDACSPHVSNSAAVAYPTEGYDVRGTISFTETSEGVRIIADIYNLTPGEHGFHIHEFGDARSSNGDAAGGHFNPEGHHHGGPESQERHVGDLGNLTADASGHAHYDRMDTYVKLNGPHSIIGRSVVIHEQSDDLESDPSGNAGPRASVGIIGISNFVKS